MLINETRKLFREKYQYKVVLVCPGSSLFRSGEYVDAISKFSDPAFLNSKSFLKFKNKESVEYAIKVASVLKNMSNFETRVESPLISVYTNSKADIDTLANISEDNVKYISVPPASGLLEGTVILPKIDYEFRATLGRTKQSNEAFIEWADKNDKVKLTNSCRRDLKKDGSWGGTYFYINGEKNLLVARMMLGTSINKVEKIVKNK